MSVIYCCGLWGDSLKVQLESLYRSYYAQVGFPAPRLVPPMKRARIHVPPTRINNNNNKHNSSQKQHQNHTNNNTTATNANFSDLKSYSKWIYMIFSRYCLKLSK